MAYQFRFLEHIALADCAFEVQGDTLSDVFMAAGQAVVEVMVNPSTVSTNWQRDIALQDEDIAALLFDWLSTIVFLKDAEGVVFRETVARVQRDKDDQHWIVEGKLLGEPIDSVRHELRADVKAVTKHLYELKQEEGHWAARVVLDI